MAVPLLAMTELTVRVADGERLVSQTWPAEEVERVPAEPSTPMVRLLESAVIQREWLAECRPGSRQWNRIEPLLVEAWRDTGASRVHFAWLPGAAEEEGTARYLAATARMAGLEARVLPLGALGWHARRRCFVDSEGRTRIYVLEDPLCEFYACNHAVVLHF